MKKVLFLVILCSIGFATVAQDIIVKNDKTEIKAKVLEITETAILYKKFEMLDGPSYSIKKTEVFMIMYQNGTKEYMATATPTPAQVTVPTVKTNTGEIKQSSSGSAAKRKAKLGMHIGVLNTNASIDNVSTNTAVITAKLGVYLTTPLSEKLSFQPAVNVVTKGTSFTFIENGTYYDEKITVYFAEIPLAFLYTTGSTKGLQLGIAPTLGINIAATEVGTARPISGGFTSSFSNTPDLKAIELSTAFLVGYIFSPKFAITALYNTGLTNLSTLGGSYKTSYLGIQTSFGF